MPRSNEPRNQEPRNHGLQDHEPQNSVSRNTVSRIGITGTDTDVGKTVVASAIIAALRASGLRVAPMKPVETGGGDDAATLRAAAGNSVPLELVRPYRFTDPLAPLVAARRAKTVVNVEQLHQTFRELCVMSDAVVVEGAGGLLVPITETHSFATLFKQWQLELIIVSANRLGCINHTLLTVECAKAHGIPIRAVVLNRTSNDRSDLAQRTNEALLKELLLTIPVVSFPYTATPRDFNALAALAHDFSTQTFRRS